MQMKCCQMKSLMKKKNKKMTMLDCSVTGCVYNEDRCCCKGDIKVEGRDAKNTADTCCGGFKERGAERLLMWKNMSR